MMKIEDAKIGQKVICDDHWGKLTGTILHIFPPYPEDEFPQGFATVKVDQRPDRWPYMGDDFAPPIEELKLIEENNE